ncbi:octopamine receptor beta-1R-like [Patiria miniata]|uniref:G-protein coupled receptors family 1 profile domain-containing protein n=1 Tax=Patiria miniata TaxID=46514 RepID=A0A914BN41_PATMI|nr:octopamine receptor beta-1R-like [Patiria miniata]
MSRSNVSYDAPVYDLFPFHDVHLVLLSVLYGIAFIAGTPGNSLVILAVLLSKKLRTTTNTFVVNLSVADLLTCLVLIPVNANVISTLYFGIGDLQVGLTLLLVTGFILYTTLGCSILTLICIALNRWLLITRPLTTYQKVYTPKKIAVCLMFVWVIPIVFVLTLGYSGLGKRYFIVVLAVAMFPIPLTVIIACYVLIWRRINRQVRSMASSSHIPEVSNEPITHNSTETQLDDIPTDSTQPQARSNSAMTTGNDQLSRHQIQITKNMFYVVCAFVLCVGPYAISLVPAITDIKFVLVSQYASAILVFNSCINPLIYATKHRDFKTVFRCIVSRQWDDIPEPSDFLKAVRRSKCCGRSNPV